MMLLIVRVGVIVGSLVCAISMCAMILYALTRKRMNVWRPVPSPTEDKMPRKHQYAPSLILNEMYCSVYADGTRNGEGRV